MASMIELQLKAISYKTGRGKLVLCKVNNVWKRIQGF